MDITMLKRVLQHINPVFDSSGKLVARPPAIMLKGDTGIGKSGFVRELAEEVWRLPMIDRRVGQMCEGDLIGLQKVDGPYTQFHPVEFIYNAAREPYVLFFDEANRGTREVMQVLFQIVLDYELNGITLHPQTRIVIAVNEGADYAVQQMDRALRDRFFHVDFTPTWAEWVEWAKTKGNVSKFIVDFTVAKAGASLEVANAKNRSERMPSRRSWTMLSEPLERLVSSPTWDPEDSEQVATLRALASGFVGNEMSIDFSRFVVDKTMRVTALQILSNWEKAKKRFAMLGGEPWAAASDIITEWTGAGNRFTADQAKQFAAMFNEMPAEHRSKLWQSIAQQRKTDDPETLHNIIIIHPDIKRKLVGAFVGDEEAERRFAEDEIRIKKLEEEEAAAAALAASTSKDEGVTNDGGE